MSGVIQHVVGNVQFGPARSLWEEQPSLRELYDQACQGLVRAECEVEELRAEVAMLLEERNILGAASSSNALRGTTVTKAAVTEGGTGDSGVERPEPPPHFDAALWKRAAVLNRAERLLLEVEHRVLRGIETRIRNERDEARVQYRSTEALAMALVKSIDELKVERNEARSSLDRLATIASEAFGPFPVQLAEDNLTAIETGIYQLRMDNYKIELERNQARKLADSAMLEADRLRGKRGACIYAIAESVREKYDPADEVDQEPI